MNYLIATAIFLSMNVHAGVDLTPTEKSKANELCATYINLKDIAHKMHDQQLYEAASGVKDLEASRFQGEQFIKSMRDLSLQDDPDLKWFQSPVANCDGFSVEDNTIVDQQAIIIAKRMGATDAQVAKMKAQSSADASKAAKIDASLHGGK